MKKVLLIVGASLLLVALLVAGAVVYVKSTPEYALARVVKQVKEEGIEAVEKHLTDEAKKKIAPIAFLAENSLVGTIVSLVSDDAVKLLVEKAENVNWSVGDVMKNSTRSNVTIEFEYENRLSGHFDIELKKVDKEWKINNLYNFKFDMMNLIG